MHAMPIRYTNDICIILINWTCMRNNTKYQTIIQSTIWYKHHNRACVIDYNDVLLSLCERNKSSIGKQTTNTCTESYNFVTIMIYASFESLKPIKPLARARNANSKHKWYMHHFDQLNIYDKQQNIQNHFSMHNMI